VAYSDLALMCYILSGAFLIGYLAHRLVKHTPLHRLVPDWESWQSGKRFPMGFSLGGALITYLLVPFL
jgi:prepilin peptidase CpaA